MGGQHDRGWGYAAWADAAVRGALAATLVAAALAPGLREYSERGVAGRFAAAVLALVAVPAWWWLLGRRRARRGYPYALDAVLGLPFLLELWGNAAGAGGLAAGGAAGHAADFLLLATALALGLARLELGPWITAALVAGGGAFGAIVWELLEHVTFATPSAERYEGTMEDLALALAASLAVAAATGVVLAGRGRERHGA